jgi:hypothetical protein
VPADAPPPLPPPTLTYNDFEAEEQLYLNCPAEPVDVRRKFVGHDPKVWNIAKVGRKMAFAKYNNLPREIYFMIPNSKIFQD